MGIPRGNNYHFKVDNGKIKPYVTFWIIYATISVKKQVLSRFEKKKIYLTVIYFLINRITIVCNDKRCTV